MSEDSKAIVSPALPIPIENSGNKFRPYLFQPGQSGNPDGRPKSKLFRKYAMRDLLADAGNGERNITHVVRRVIGEAVEGKDCIRAAEFLRDTVDGRPSSDTETGSAAAIIYAPTFIADTEE